jgi:hypothetical protein
VSWAIATIVAKDHLAHARVLAGSLAEHHPDVRVHVLLADRVGGCFDPGAEPFLLTTAEELDIPGFRAMAFRYDKQALSYALTPWFIEHLLDGGLERVVFVKQESLVTGSLDPLLDPLERACAVLTPHLLDPLGGPDATDRELNILQSGVYNLGVVALAARGNGRRLLGWWKDRLKRHCRREVTRGMHFEQRWMDLAPAHFPDVEVLHDPRVNVGHWNLRERQEVLAGDVRLVRFSGFDPSEPDRVTRYDPRRVVADTGAAARWFAEFADRLRAAGHDEASRWPYAYGAFTDGVTIPEMAREVHLSLGEVADAFGDPFRTGEGSFAAWARGLNGRPVPTLWDRVLRERPDVRHRYPDAGGRGFAGFAAWAREHGCAEHGIPAALAPVAS